MRLSAIDRRILNFIQEDIPFEVEPFKTLSKKVGIDREEFIERLKKLKEEKFIRTFSARLNHKRLKFKSTLLGLKIPLNKIESIAGDIVKYPEVTHCYLREGEYNLWVVFLCLKKKRLDGFLRKLSKQIGRGNILNLTTKRQFKLKTDLKI